ncbi:adenylosuccinate synthetase [Tamlana sp. s12]|uniref:adenylosuccinate synthetase n=1 Tax=Tamlana sp. s12 TaxID=1630406 RepID=UPI0009ED8F74|nr:adenylosuccinate synthetase [Tamlana sp. s12]QQY81468.1 adenylosuccinate synthetase [Tamlana sp. s12]
MKSLINFIALQLPIGTPNPDDNQPLDLSDPFEVIVFIILPIVIAILYFLWRKQNQKDKK